MAGKIIQGIDVISARDIRDPCVAPQEYYLVRRQLDRGRMFNFQKPHRIDGK